MSLLHRDVTEQVLRAFYAVHSEVGHGFLESVYESSLAMALRDLGLHVDRQRSVAVTFRGFTVGEFRADLVVEGRVVVEIKAAKAIDPIHESQLLNYLRASQMEVGLLLNFGARASFRRLVYTNERKALTAAREHGVSERGA